MIPSQHIIDLDADPIIPHADWVVEEHRGGGHIAWDPSRILLHPPEQDPLGFGLNGHGLRNRLKGLAILNANVLDFLFFHQELIPEEWKGQVVHFWGTIYCINPADRRPDNCLMKYVRNLFWSNDDTWMRGAEPFREIWSGPRPAAVLLPHVRLPEARVVRLPASLS